MEIVKNLNQIRLEKNEIVLKGMAELKNTVICFKGEGNICVLEEGVKISNSKVVFGGNNSVVYFSRSKCHEYKVQIAIFQKSALFFGEDNYFNNTLHISVDERENVIIGSNGLFSLDIWIRTGDPHLVYDCNEKKRINSSKSILIGDHVWVGQRVMLMKGTKIGSGSILGAASFISNKEVESNSMWGGNPARRCKDNVFFLTKACHAFDEEESKKYRECKSEEWIYEKDDSVIDFEIFDRTLKAAVDARERLSILEEMLQDSQKNRFYIEKRK